MDSDQTYRVQPSVYAIEVTATCDGQAVTHRYEAPTVDEVIALAKRGGEDFPEPPLITCSIAAEANP